MTEALTFRVCDSPPHTKSDQALAHNATFHAGVLLHELSVRAGLPGAQGAFAQMGVQVLIGSAVRTKK